MRIVNDQKLALAFALILLAALNFSLLANPQEAADATILGTVRSADGEPQRGVAVIATRSAPSSRDSVSFSRVTGAEGNYKFEGLPAGRYSITAGSGIPSGETSSGILDVPAGKELTVDFSMPPPATRSRVVNGKMTMNAESAGKPLPKRLTFGNATVATHADGTLTALMPPGMRRITVHAPDGYFVESVTTGSALVYSAQELQRTPNPMAFPISIPLEPNPTPDFIITLGTRTTPSQ